MMAFGELDRERNGHLATDDMEDDENEEEDYHAWAGSVKLKILHTSCVYAGLLGLGLSYSALGPSLLDLQSRVAVDLETITFLFTAAGVGLICGCFLGGFLFDYLNGHLLLGVALALSAILEMVVPLCKPFTAMAIVLGVARLFAGAIMAAGNAFTVRLWGKKNGPYMLGLHFMYAAGSFLGPLLCEPFLTDHQTFQHSTVSTDNTAGTAAMGAASNISVVLLNGASTSLSPIITKGNTTSPPPEGENQIHLAYIIIGCIRFLIAVPFFVVFAKSPHPRKPLPALKEKSDLSETTMEWRGMRWQALYIVAFIVIFFFYCSLEFCYSQLLQTFASVGLGWSRAHGALVTSVFFGAFGISRLIFIPLIKCVPPYLVVGVNIALSFLAMIVILVAVTKHFVILWICSGIMGFGLGPVFPAIITWASQYTEVTRMVMGGFSLFGAVGVMALPPLIGHLIGQFGGMAIMYTLLFEIICCLIVVVLIKILTWKCVTIVESEEVEKEDLGVEMETFLPTVYANPRPSPSLRDVDVEKAEKQRARAPPIPPPSVQSNGTTRTPPVPAPRNLPNHQPTTQAEQAQQQAVPQTAAGPLDMDISFFYDEALNPFKDDESSSSSSSSSSSEHTSELYQGDDDDDGGQGGGDENPNDELEREEEEEEDDSDSDSDSEDDEDFKGEETGEELEELPEAETSTISVNGNVPPPKPPRLFGSPEKATGVGVMENIRVTSPEGIESPPDVDKDHELKQQLEENDAAPYNPFDDDDDEEENCESLSPSEKNAGFEGMVLENKSFQEQASDNDLDNDLGVRDDDIRNKSAFGHDDDEKDEQDFDWNREPSPFTSSDDDS